MDWLNYHHLYYFWVVMREGTITAACVKLRLAQSTVSAQLSQLEENLGGKLFYRQGRVLKPTDLGRLTFRYADQIFSLGLELMDQVRGRPVSGPVPLRVGVVDVVPKSMVRELLKPALDLPEKVNLSCHEGKAEYLLTELALHNLDVVIADTPKPTGIGIKVYNHFLGECGVTFFAAPELTKKLTSSFPGCLNGFPMLFPMKMTKLRGMLEQWFERHNIKPVITGEFDDNALLTVFGQEGDGVFVAPTAIEFEIQRQYQVEIIGRSKAIKERFYAISVDRILKHPAVVAISDAAKHSIF